MQSILVASQQTIKLLKINAFLRRYGHRLKHNLRSWTLSAGLITQNTSKQKRDLPFTISEPIWAATSDKEKKAKVLISDLKDLMHHGQFIFPQWTKENDRRWKIYLTHLLLWVTPVIHPQNPHLSLTLCPLPPLWCQHGLHPSVSCILTQRSVLTAWLRVSQAICVLHTTRQTGRKTHSRVSLLFKCEPGSASVKQNKLYVGHLWRKKSSL